MDYSLYYTYLKYAIWITNSLDLRLKKLQKYLCTQFLFFAARQFITIDTLKKRNLKPDIIMQLFFCILSFLSDFTRNIFSSLFHFWFLRTVTTHIPQKRNIMYSIFTRCSFISERRLDFHFLYFICNFVKVT